ncbi:alcohol oxidase [Mycena crocata]|nr:alcohol oxidase [Mycena crocata]
MLLPSLAVLSLFAAGGLAKVYEDVADLPGLQYDFVIVGAGTAGNVLANRLTENPKVSVLVIEAGVTNEGVLTSEVPGLLGQLLGDASLDWNYTSIPMAGVNGRTIFFPRAFFMGGCSAHNGLVYTRGAADDFNRYAALTGDQGWSWNKMLPYFLKHEKWSPPADNHDTTGQFTPSVHGTNGPIGVSLSGYSWPEFEKKIIETTQQLPNDFPYNQDVNSGNPLGISWLQSSIAGGVRSTSARGYLAPNFISRPNLHVLLHAQVSKLVNPTKKAGTTAFGGVQFKYGSSLFTAKASKEIVLAAGVVGTPQILQNSGIGDPAALNPLGIQTVLDLPSVGRNLSDHVFYALQWAVNSTQTLESLTLNATAQAAAMAEWNRTHTGPFVDTPIISTHTAWLRLPDDSPVFDSHPDPSPGPTGAHFEFLLIPGGGVATGATPPAHGMTIGIQNVSPLSRGSVMINSSDPFAPPLIDFGYLSNEFDLVALRAGVDLARRFVTAPTWTGYLGAMTPDITGFTTAQLETHIRDNAGQGYHVVGTAGMSAPNAAYGVVNPDLRVKGTVGLSVIDASVVPIVPSAHTQAITYALAERGADILKQRYA